MAVVNNSRTTITALTDRGVNTTELTEKDRELLPPVLPRWKFIGRARADRRRVLIDDGKVVQDVRPEIARELLR